MTKKGQIGINMPTNTPPVDTAAPQEEIVFKSDGFIYDRNGFVLAKAIRPEAFKQALQASHSHLIEEVAAMKRPVTECQHTPNDSCDTTCMEQEKNTYFNESIDQVILLLQARKDG